MHIVQSLIPYFSNNRRNYLAPTPNIIYVSATAPVIDGPKDGSRERPYADLTFMSAVPTSQAEYETRKVIEILDASTYTAPATIAMGLYTVRVNAALVVGSSNYEVDSGERFGSSVAPEFYVQKDLAIIPTGWTGDIKFILKSGGSAVSLLRVAVSGIIFNGEVVISDGTNEGTSCASLPVFSMYRSTITAGGFKGRNAICGFTQANLSDPTYTQEFGYINSVQNCSILSTSIAEKRSSTAVKTIRDLTLNTTGSITWDSVSVRNWNVDAPSADEIINKITSYPDQIINPIKVGAEAIATDDVGGYYTTDDVEGNLQEIGATLSTLSSFYLPLSGASPMEGTLDMDGFDIDNIKQAINDGASAANPAFLTGDSGWYGTTAKTMHLSISGSDVAWLNVNGYDILDANAMFGDVQQQESGLGVYLDQSNKRAYLGDWRGTTSDTYLETDSSVGFHRFYVNGTQVLDIQANSFEVLVNPHTPDTTVNTSTYSITGTDNLIRVTYTSTGACTLTLPTLTAALDGVYIQIKDAGYNAGTNNITINRSGSDTIEGSATSYVMDSDGQKITLYGDFTNNNWEVV